MLLHCDGGDSWERIKIPRWGFTLRVLSCSLVGGCEHCWLSLLFAFLTRGLRNNTLLFWLGGRPSWISSKKLCCFCFLRLVLTLQDLQLCMERSWANRLVNGAPVDFLLYREVRQTCLPRKLNLRTGAQESLTTILDKVVTRRKCY